MDVGSTRNQDLVGRTQIRGSSLLFIVSPAHFTDKLDYNFVK
jgi:hypothetical protein